MTYFWSIFTCPKIIFLSIYFPKNSPKFMATLTPVIVPAKVLKDGKHKVRISVAHNSEFRYIVTDIVIDSAKEFKNGQIVKRPDAALLNAKVRSLIQRYQKAIDTLDYIEGLSCTELVFQLKNYSERKAQTLKFVFEEYLSNADIKPSTAQTYRTHYRCITSCIGENTAVGNITHANVLALDKYMRSKRKLKPGTRCVIYETLMLIINYAKKCGYADKSIDPMGGIKRQKGEPRQSWLTVEQIKQIRDYKTNGKRAALTRDMFMLSYYLGGVNMADLVNINFKANADTIRYVRKKTEARVKVNKYVEFAMPDEAKEIIKRIIGKDGRIAMSQKERDSCCHSFMTYNIRKIAKDLAIPNLVFYSARKSFSQHAFCLGIEASTIDYILGHKMDSGGSCLYYYVAVTPEMATAAIKKVLDNLK